MSEPDVEDADRDAAETAEGTLADTLAEVLPGETAAGTGDGEAPPDEDILERIEQADPEEIAGLFAALGQHVESLEDQLEDRDEELEDLQSRLRRKQADFQNYKKRQKERLAEEKQRATEDLVERLVDVRDNLARALDQDEDADIRDGVETTLRGFDDVLEAEGVEAIEPEPGEEVDPQRHETLATIESDQPEGTVAERHRPGYEMAGKVIRPAQVVTSDEPGDHGDSGAGDSADETAENEAGADS